MRMAGTRRARIPVLAASAVALAAVLVTAATASVYELAGVPGH